MVTSVCGSIGNVGGLEGWRVGGSEGWKVGRLEGWKVGRLEGWKVGGFWRVGVAKLDEAQSPTGR